MISERYTSVTVTAFYTAKSFRRLKHKTQVFLAPEGDHYRTRLTHTLEVAQIARTISRALQLNEDLTEAIALGHDLGHTPLAIRESGSWMNSVLMALRITSRVCGLWKYWRKTEKA